MRKYSWPDGHWNWPVDLTHKHGVRAGEMIFTGGQVDLDRRGNVRHPEDLRIQCIESMKYMDAILRDLEVDFGDLVRLVVYFNGDQNDEEELLDLLTEIMKNGFHVFH